MKYSVIAYNKANSESITEVLDSKKFSVIKEYLEGDEAKEYLEASNKLVEVLNDKGTASSNWIITIVPWLRTK